MSRILFGITPKNIGTKAENKHYSNYRILTANSVILPQFSYILYS